MFRFYLNIYTLMKRLTLFFYLLFKRLVNVLLVFSLEERLDDLQVHGALISVLALGNISVLLAVLSC